MALFEKGLSFQA